MATRTHIPLDLLLSGTSDIVLAKDLEGRHIFANESARTFLDLPMEDIIGKTDDELFPGGRGLEIMELDRRIMQTRVSDQRIERIHTPKGEFHFHATKWPWIEDEITLGLLAIVRDVTDEQLVRRQLAESEELHRTTLANISDTVLITDDHGDFTWICPNVATIFGYSQDEVSQLGNVEALMKSLKFDRDILVADGELTNIDVQVSDKEGSPHGLLVNIKKVSIGGGTTLYSCRDISEQRLVRIELENSNQRLQSILDSSKEAERALVESEDRYRTVFESGADVFLVFDLDGNLVDVNQKACETYGYSKDEMLTLSGRDIVAPSYQHMFKDFSETKIGEWFRTESMDVRKDGTFFEIQVHGTRLSLAGQERLLAIVRDITEEKANQQALAESETRFRNLTEATSDWIWEVDEKATYTYCSPAVTDLLGHDPDEIIGKTPFDLMPPDEAQRVAEIFGPIVQSQKPFARMENVNLHANGSKVVMDTSGVPIFNERGEFKGYRGIDRDITDRHAAQLALEESETRFRNLTEATSDWIWEIDEKATFIYCSPQATDIFGYEAEGLIGKTIFDLMPPEEAERMAHTFKRVAREQKPFSGLENIILHSDGTQIIMDINAVPVFSEERGFIGFRGIGRDITDKKHAEIRLRKEKELADGLTTIEMMLSSTLELTDGLPQILNEVVGTVDGTSACLDMLENDIWNLSHCDEGSSPPALLADSRIENNRILVVENAGVLVNKSDGYIGVPIVQRDTLIGVISILWNDSSKPTKSETEFCKKLGFLLSLAIENSRLYIAERNIADTLQSSLLGTPSSIKGIDFGLYYHSATEAATVGGDFYDLFELGMGRVGVVIGDVSGKGIEASTLTSLVKHTLRAHAFDGERPEVIVRKASEAVLRSSESNNFVTLFFGVLDCGGGVLEYCCAGHPRPMYISAGTAQPLELAQSPAIGMFPDVQFRHGTITLDKDAKLLLYTDGVIESRTPHGEMYGEDRLISCLDNNLGGSTEKLPHAIFTDVSKFAAGILHDDIALMSLSLTKST